ncbi:MAG: hypothetical protein LC126_15590 [Bryobacterales bacterium]|nr:hypothetical protein [Bryobacterales bacterium]
MNISTMVCALGWGSVFVLWWAWLMGALEVGTLSICAMVFFVLMGAGGGVMMLSKPTK